MFAQSVSVSAVADISWQRALGSAARSRKWRARFWKRFVTSLTDTPDGVLLVDKAEGMTSHDVVALVRRRLQIKKVGHCGTLDPIATGLLLLTLGRGTKIQDLLMSEDKEYSGTMTLGVSTATHDREGAIIETREVPPFSDDAIRAAFEKFRGDFYQMPPMVSAIKHGGVPLYKLARQGKTIEREARLVHVYRYSIDRIGLPDIDFTVVCSKGFYVRTYAHDVGEELGCGAHLAALRRVKSGQFDVANAISVDQIKISDPAEIIARVLSLPQVSRMRGA